MAKLLKLRRGSTTQHNSFTGAEGEVTIDTTKDTAVVHDGSQAGGRPLLREDMSNLPAGTIDNADINASAAIAGTKISPNFGSQQVETTGAILANNGLVAKASTEPQIVVQDSDTGNTGNAAETSIQYKDGGGTVQGQIGFHDVNSSNLFIDTQATSQPINCRVGGSSTQLLIDNAGIDVSGNITTTGDIRVPDNKSIFIGNSDDFQFLHRTADNTSIISETGGGDLSIETNGSQAHFYDKTNGRIMAEFVTGGACSFKHGATTRLATTSSGATVTGDLAVTGSLANGVTATTQSASDNSTKVATTAYTDTAISTLTTTVNNNLATKLPLAGGTLTGNLAINTGNSTNDITAGNIFRIMGNDVRITNGSGSEGMIFAAADGAVSLYHGMGSGTTAEVKLATSSTGVSITGALTASGDVTAFSDQTLKKDITTINDALGLCGKLRGVSYKWIKDDKPSIGVIAQEIEQHIPEIVSTTQLDGKDVKSVDYGKIVGVLINAVNELKAELDEYKGLYEEKNFPTGVNDVEKEIGVQSTLLVKKVFNENAPEGMS